MVRNVSPVTFVRDIRQGIKKDFGVSPEKVTGFGERSEPEDSEPAIDDIPAADDLERKPQGGNPVDDLAPAKASRRTARD